MNKKLSLIVTIFSFQFSNCSYPQNVNIVKPVVITEPVNYDTDDPAIWVNPKNSAQSLIIGTDKDANGGLFVFDLNGKALKDKTVKGLKRPNNVDVGYGLTLNGKSTDFAITTERLTHKLRVFSLPDMKEIDHNGIDVFEGETTGKEFNAPMGIAVYHAPNGKIYAIISRKNGPTDGYLWQYLLSDDGTGNVKGTLLRKFGKFVGGKEIEAIAVDNQLGFVYYSDEQSGIHQYYADPAKGNEELAFFGNDTGFKADQEGISIYQLTDSTGYILVSDQGANRFQIFRREGDKTHPFSHPLLTKVDVSTNHSDGSEVVAVPLNDQFKHGLFVTMSDDKTFHYYRWEDIAGKVLKMRY